MKKLLTTIFGSLLVLNTSTSVYCWDVSQKLIDKEKNPNIKAYLDTYKSFKQYVNKNIDKKCNYLDEPNKYWAKKQKYKNGFESTLALLTYAATGVFGIDVDAVKKLQSENERVEARINSGLEIKTETGDKNNLATGRRAYFCSLVQSVINCESKDINKGEVLGMLLGWSIWETVGEMVVDNILSYDSQSDIDSAFNDAINKIDKYLLDEKNYTNDTGAFLGMETVNLFPARLKECVSVEPDVEVSIVGMLKNALRSSWDCWLTQFGIISPVQHKNGIPALDVFIDSAGKKKNVTSCSAMLKGSYNLFKELSLAEKNQPKLSAKMSKLKGVFLDDEGINALTTNSLIKTIQEKFPNNNNLVDICDNQDILSQLENKCSKDGLDLRRNCIQLALNDYLEELGYKANDVKVGKHSTEYKGKAKLNSNDEDDKKNSKQKKQTAKKDLDDKQDFKPKLKKFNKKEDYWNLETFNIKLDELPEDKQKLFDSDGNIITRDLFFLRCYSQQDEEMSTLTKSKDMLLKQALKDDKKQNNGKSETIKCIDNQIKGIKGIQNTASLKKTIKLFNWQKAFDLAYQDAVTSAKGALKRIQLERLALEKEKEKPTVQKTGILNKKMLTADFIFDCDCFNANAEEKTSDELFDYNAFLKSIAKSLNKKLREGGFETYDSDTAVDAYLENVREDVGYKMHSKPFMMAYHALRNREIAKLYSRLAEKECLTLWKENNSIKKIEALTQPLINFEKFRKIKTKNEVEGKINELIEEIVNNA